ncbi:TPA: hypothetical protein F8A23_08715 [Legionella pneumophila]|uniref:hypothetical protein n=1 Tax=Legionella TaxID=445 RepID=UPI000875B24B|nr:MULTISPECIES: hypothetical protein [Legionella]BCL64461.1 hypothetical protein [Legionella pneumophila serogroup 7]HAT2038718.1 hypothetical protein [Legionella pneumophila]AOW57829.1 hypothetical protein BE843_05920 [Legionella pneumophila subsp. pneumophila]AOW61987.1 hypothetical protein BE844_12850 [Legionella pneumophila subsp. pneumophila]AOW67385.1 hypothetical protein BE846_10615 [Legionella pneumophila subsp. pneumophila]
MNSKIDSLALALKQSFLGIFPRRTYIDDYAKVKARIKKELKILLTVKEIDQIIFFVIRCISSTQNQCSLLQYINSEQAKNIVSSSTVLLKEFYYEISHKMDKSIANQAIGIVIEEMIQFKDPTKFIKNTISWRPKIVWGDKTYESKKSQLQSLLKRELLTEELHLIAEVWSYYMAFIEDLHSPDNYTKEKIKELKTTMTALIAHLEGVVKSSRELIDQLRDFDRFPWVDIDAKEKSLLDNQSKLDEAKALAELLRQDNGYKLSTNHIQKLSFFSMFFLGELMGLHEPEYKKDGNPLLTFLDILTGWTESQLDKEVTRKRISKYYSKYKQFKLNQNTKPLIDSLLRCHQEQGVSLSIILKEFQSHLLKLSIKPRALSIAPDA